MQNLLQRFNQPLTNIRTWVVATFFVVALVGFADATFLTVEHYRGVIPPCTTAGCDTVLTSFYSSVMGVPASLLGALYYLVMAIGSFLYLEAHMNSAAGVGTGRAKILQWVFVGTIAGLLMSIYFVSLQAFVIHAWCQYCIGSAVTSTVLFIIALCVLCKKK